MLPAPLKRLLARPGRPFAVLAVLAVLGLAVVLMSLAEVWRRQGLELQTASEARRALQAVAAGLQTQRALAAHRPYAAAVLAGRTQQEPERLRRQQAVDTEVGTLVAALEAQRLHRALDETDQLRHEWAHLLEGIGGRKMAAAASDAAHDVLIEQLFVIMDLTAGASGLQGQIGRALRAEPWTLALQTLPRLTLAIDTCCTGPEPLAHAEDVAQHTRATAQRAARSAEKLLAALDATGADEPAPDAALVRALVALRQSAAHLAETAGAPAANGASNSSGNPAGSAPAGPRSPAAARAAQAASVHATSALIAHLDRALATSSSAIRSERLWVAASGLIALLVGTLAAALAFRLGAPAPGQRTEWAGVAPEDAAAQALDTSAGPGGAESQRPASDLLLRLRRGEAWTQAQAEADGDSATRPPPPPGL